MTGIHVHVVDGDSLRAGNERIRLLGIDAPELHQTCLDADSREWTCGRSAWSRLNRLVSSGTVACTAHGQDRYGRTLAVCSAGDVADLGRAMVRDGLAVNYGDFGDGYPVAELEARAKGRGLWAGNFERPQDWRRRHPRRAER